MLLVFGLGSATFASTGSGSCCKGDSCQMMMKKDASGRKSCDCCHDCDGCKGNETKTVGAYLKGRPFYYKTGKVHRDY